jgi:hypothetical protein
MSLKRQRGSLEIERNLERIVKEVDDHRPRRVPARLPSASSLARRLLLLPAIRFLGVLVLQKASLDWQRLEGKRLGERLGAPTVLFMRGGKDIVALDRGAHPEKFGRWKGFLNRITVGSFGIQAKSYSVDWLV